MKDTIFTPSFGNRPTALVGRDAMIRQLTEMMDSMPGSKERSVLMTGQRGSGKTALLWEIADIARKKGFIVTTPTVASDGMLGRIVEKLVDDAQNRLKKGNTHVKGGSVGAFGFSVGVEFDKDDSPKSYQHKILQISRELTQRGYGVLILIDELQGNSKEIRDLVILYQEMVGEGLNVALLMAGLPMAVSAVLNDHVLTFLNRSRKVSVEPLKQNDIEAYFVQSFAKLGIKINDKSCRDAACKTFGSPYMMQLIGHLITINTGDNGIVTEKIYKKAFSDAKEEFENDVCITTMANLSDKDREFLTCMALEDDICSISSIAKRMNVTSDYAGKYRIRLLSTGIIETPGRGKLRIAVPYLRDYLRKL